MAEPEAMYTQADSIEALTALLVSVCDPDKRTGLKKLFFSPPSMPRQYLCVNIYILDLGSNQTNR